MEEVQQFSSEIIDLTAGPASYQIIAATPKRFRVLAIEWEIKAVNACTAAPTESMGSNGPAFNNLSVAAAHAGFTTQAAETRVIVPFLVPVPYIDLTASGLHVNVTASATAVDLTARLIVVGSFLPV